MTAPVGRPPDPAPGGMQRRDLSLELESRSSFLNLAGLIQGGLLLGSLVLIELFDLPVWDRLRWSWRDCGWGLLATLPMIAVLAGAGRLRRLVGDLIGKPLSLCTWYDLVLIAALAGVGEELLFRGVLTAWIGRIDPWTGVIAVNVIFALLHAVTPAYFVLAAAFGFYLSFLAEQPGAPNLLRPIITHAVYDYIAFLWIVREYRMRKSDPPISDF